MIHGVRIPRFYLTIGSLGAKHADMGDMQNIFWIGFQPTTSVQLPIVDVFVLKFKQLLKIDQFFLIDFFL